MTKDQPTLFYILSLEHTTSVATWWRPRENGYTTDLNSAGQYTLEQARKICRQRGDPNAIPNEIAIPCEDTLVTRTVVDLDNQRMRFREFVKHYQQELTKQ